MNIARPALVASATVLLTACVTPNYAPPGAPNSPTLIVRTNTSETFNQQVRLFNDADCSDYPGKLVGLLHSKRIGIDTKESMETRLSSGKPIAVSVFAAVARDDTALQMLLKGVNQTASENRFCEAFVTFTPELGATYVASYKIDGSPCSIALMKVEKGGQATVVTNSRPSPSCAGAAKKAVGRPMLTN